MYKSRRFSIKTTGVILSLVLYGSALYGQQNTTDHDRSSVLQRNEQKQLEIEKQRKWVENELQKHIIPEAVAIIEETKKALNFIDNGQNNKAKAAIERANNKVNDLLTHHPATALLPVDFDINIIDEAPIKLDNIREIAGDAERAMREKYYPEARLFLDTLQSEIRVYIFCLPLGIYPSAFKKAEQLLDQNNSKEAALALEAALDALVVMQRTLPIPLIESKVLLVLAEEKQKENNKDAALRLLTLARYELERTKALGYMSKDESEYNALNESFRNLEKQINNNTSTPSAFQSLKERFNAFLKRYFGERKQSVNQQSNNQQLGNQDDNQ
jgi:hypothetical protein